MNNIIEKLRNTISKYNFYLMKFNENTLIAFSAEHGRTENTYKDIESEINGLLNENYCAHLEKFCRDLNEDSYSMYLRYGSSIRASTFDLDDDDEVLIDCEWFINHSDAYMVLPSAKDYRKWLKDSAESLRDDDYQGIAEGLERFADDIKDLTISKDEFICLSKFDDTDYEICKSYDDEFAFDGYEYRVGIIIRNVSHININRD